MKGCPQLGRNTNSEAAPENPDTGMSALQQSGGVRGAGCRGEKGLKEKQIVKGENN